METGWDGVDWIYLTQDVVPTTHGRSYAMKLLWNLNYVGMNCAELAQGKIKQQIL
jgi:hypothetical protein